MYVYIYTPVSWQRTSRSKCLQRGLFHFRSSLGRFSSFPYDPLPPLLASHQPTLPPDKTIFSIVQNISSAADSCFPRVPPVARKPYISSFTISLIEQLPLSNPDDEKSLRNKMKKSSKLDKQKWIASNLHLDYIGSPSEHWKTIKRIRSKYQPRTQTVNKPDGTPSLESEKSTALLTVSAIMFGTSLHSQIPLKILLLLLNLTSNLHLPCWNSIALSAVPKLEGPLAQTISQWRLFVSFPIPSRNSSFLTMIVSLLVLPRSLET